MFVLGIDPGLSRCGYGLVSRAEGTAGLRAHAAGVVETDPAAPLAERLLILHTELRALVQELRPAAVVVERVFFQVNAKTAMSVGQASGLALLVAAEGGCEVVQYTSNEVKLSVVGYGGGHQGPGAAHGGPGAWACRRSRGRPTWPTPWPWRCATSPRCRCGGLWTRRSSRREPDS